MTEWPDVMKVEQVAAFLQMHPNAIQAMLRAHKLPGRKVGAEWRVLRSELEAWLRQSEPVRDGEDESD